MHFYFSGTFIWHFSSIIHHSTILNVYYTILAKILNIVKVEIVNTKKKSNAVC